LSGLSLSFSFHTSHSPAIVSADEPSRAVKSRTMKQAAPSSINQGGGKRRGMGNADIDGLSIRTSEI
jgi:hypothetical protein